MKKLAIRSYLAECIGTFVLVVFGCGTAVLSGVDLVATSLAFGLVIVAMAYSVGNISGCHINPAVSLAMALEKKMTWKDFAGYVVSQTLGAVLGAATLWLVFGDNAALGANSINEANVAGAGALELMLGLLAEIVLTFVFIFAILGVTSKTENKAVVGLVIGLTLVLVHLLGVRLTGTSVNPARSIGPALLQGGIALRQLWIFIVGPLAGSVIATAAHRCLTRQA